MHLSQPTTGTDLWSDGLSLIESDPSVAYPAGRLPPSPCVINISDVIAVFRHDTATSLGGDEVCGGCLVIVDSLLNQTMLRKIKSLSLSSGGLKYVKKLIRSINKI